MRSPRVLVVVFLLAFAFLLAPFIILFVVSFGETLAFPPRGLTLDWYPRAVSMRMFREAFQTSLIVGLLATLIVLVFGIPAAYAIVRFLFKGRELLEFTFTAPIIVPMLVIGFALLRFLVHLGRIPVLPGLLIGHTILVFPFAVRITAASLRNFDFLTEEAAMSLGASRWKAFFRVVLPNLKTGVLAAFILGFTMSFNDVAVSLFLTGPGVTMLPIQMLMYVEYHYDPLVAAVSVLTLLFTVSITLVAERVLRLSKHM